MLPARPRCGRRCRLGTADRKLQRHRGRSTTQMGPCPIPTKSSSPAVLNEPRRFQRNRVFYQTGFLNTIGNSNVRKKTRLRPGWRALPTSAASEVQAPAAATSTRRRSARSCARTPRRGRAYANTPSVAPGTRCGRTGKASSEWLPRPKPRPVQPVQHPERQRAAATQLQQLWSCAPEDAVIEAGVQARWFGPVLATALAELPDAPGMNLIQGAAARASKSGSCRGRKTKPGRRRPQRAGTGRDPLHEPPLSVVISYPEFRIIRDP
jgi:hypothetical protein